MTTEAAVRDRLPHFATLILRDDSSYDIAVQAVGGGEPIVWRSELTLAAANEIAERMTGEGEDAIKFFGINSDLELTFNFDYYLEDEGWEDEEGEPTREENVKSVRESIRDGLRVPKAWDYGFSDYGSDDRVTIAAEAIMHASNTCSLIFDPSQVDVIQRLDIVDLNGNIVYAIKFYTNISENPDHDPYIYLNISLDEPEDDDEDGEE